MDRLTFRPSPSASYWRPRPAGFSTPAPRVASLRADAEEGAPVDPNEPQERGRVDSVSLLYVVGGIPAMILFFVVIFVLAHTCDLPA